MKNSKRIRNKFRIFTFGNFLRNGLTCSTYQEHMLYVLLFCIKYRVKFAALFNYAFKSFIILSSETFIYR